MPSVVKHSYIKGTNRLAKAGAHINYIQYRSGEDRGKEPRQFFDDKRSGIQGREVKQDLRENGGKYIHKMILSPGVDGVDMQAYSRAILGQLGREKGLDIEWRGIAHENTDHIHAHLIIFGKDKTGKEVQFRREDHAKIRELGDRYIARHHEYERFLDRGLERLLKEPGYTREGDEVYTRLLTDLKRDSAGSPERTEKATYKAREWDREKAIEHLPDEQKIVIKEQTYSKFSSLEELKALSERVEAGEEAWLPKEKYKALNSWIGTKERAGDDYFDRQAKEKWDRKEKKKEKKLERLPGEDEREFNKLNKDIKKALQERDGDASSVDFGKGYKQRLRETQGRLGADHGHYTANQEIQKLLEQAEADPSRKEELEQKIEELKRWDQEQRNSESGRWKDLDSMLGDRYAREQKELAQLLAKRDEPLPVREPGQQEGPGLRNAEEKEPAKELETGKQQEVKLETGRWQDLDALVGDRYGRHDYDSRQLAKEQERQVGQEQARQFQDLTISEAQKPVLERDEPNRDDGEDLFAQGNMR